MEITKEQIDRFISFASAEAGPESSDAYFENICEALRKLETKNKEAGDEKMETIRLDREDIAKAILYRGLGPGGGGGGGNAGSPESITQHIIIKRMRNALITVMPSVIKIEADFIDFGSLEEQKKLRKKYGIDSEKPEYRT